MLIIGRFGGFSRTTLQYQKQIKIKMTALWDKWKMIQQCVYLQIGIADTINALP